MANRNKDLASQGDGTRRRDFLRYSGAAVGGGIVGAGLLAQAAQPAQAAQVSATTAAVAADGTLTATPIRPPAAALAVRGPYLSTWLPATVLPGTWQEFWAGHTTAVGGIIRIDGVAYEFMGDPTIILNVPNGNYGTPTTTQDFEQALQQTGLTVTPTRSVYELEGGGVEVTVEFLSPVEPGDLARQSIPMSYIQLSARSIDGKKHDVQIYADISGEWCSGDDTQEITWAPASVPYRGGQLQTW